MSAADEGRLPTFLIAGVPKTGTTTLAAHLARHPQVFMTTEKELHFFDRDWAQGLDAYRARFAGSSGARVVGEATPTYVVIPDAFARMADALPDARLVVMVRHPVDRAYSHYWFNRWRDDRSFPVAVDEELAETSTRWGYVAHGAYITHIERVLERYPREHLHIVVLDDLRASPAAVFDDLCRFLDVEAGAIPGDLTEVHNPAFRFRSRRVLMFMFRTSLWTRAPRIARAVERVNRTAFRYPPMEPGVRARLLEHYREPNRRLEEFLGRELAGWRS